MARRAPKPQKPLTPLGERIERALTAANLSQGQAEKRAGLGDASLSQTMTVERPQIGLSTLQKLATALGVRLAWLAIGEEPMREHSDGAVIELDERYPNRARAVAAARRDGYSEAAIAEVMVPLKNSNDLPQTEWAVEIHAAEQRLKKFGQAAAKTQPVGDEDDDTRTLDEKIAAVVIERETAASAKKRRR